jgi:hypothetical protein
VPLLPIQVATLLRFEIDPQVTCCPVVLLTIQVGTVLRREIDPQVTATTHHPLV